MNNTTKRKRQFVFAIGIVIGVVIGSVGVGFASSNSKTIVACANKKTGVLRLTSSGKCRKSEERVVWNQPSQSTLTDVQGIAGPQGPAGPSGPQGPAGAAGSSGSGSSGLPFTALSVCGVSGDSPCTVGSIGPGGGIIFFVDSLGNYPDFDYLEAAPEDASAGVPWIVNGRNSCGDGTQTCENNWLTTRTDIDDFVAVGTGRAATLRTIVKPSRTSLATYAAGVATLYSTPSAADWYLPSYNELELMYDNLKSSGLGGFADGRYASSSETGIATVFLAIDFTDRSFAMPLKTESTRVRPIRHF